MQAPRWSIYARLALAAIAAGVASGCAPVWHHPAPAPYYASPAPYYDYHYYPAIDAYYDPRVRTYIYLDHTRWVRARTLPVHVRPYRGHYVTVRSSHQRPYEEHRRHREQYPRQRYVNEHDHQRPPAHRGGDRRSDGPRRPVSERTRDDRRAVRSDRDRGRQDSLLDRRHLTGSAPPRERTVERQDPRRSRTLRPRDDRRDRTGVPAGSAPTVTHDRAASVRQVGAQPAKTRNLAATRQRASDARAGSTAGDAGRKRTPREPDGPARAGKGDKPAGNYRHKDEAKSRPRIDQRDRNDRTADHSYQRRRE